MTEALRAVGRRFKDRVAILAVGMESPLASVRSSAANLAGWVLVDERVEIHLARTGPLDLERSDLALAPIQADDPSLADALSRILRLSDDYYDKDELRRFGAEKAATNQLAAAAGDASSSWWATTTPSGEIVGVSHVTVSETRGMHIAYLGVVPQARHEGIGSWMISELVHRVAGRATTTIFGDISVYNTPVVRLMSRSGVQARTRPRKIFASNGIPR